MESDLIIRGRWAGIPLTQREMNLEVQAVNPCRTGNGDAPPSGRLESNPCRCIQGACFTKPLPTWTR
jgi:hypothetical protein